MFGFGSRGARKLYGAIVDVGSGSVGLAIVESEPGSESPKIVWHHRERMVVRDIDTIDDSAKQITTALFNAILTLGNDGIKALTDHQSGAAIDTVQISIAAPWSYTITKTVRYDKEEPFTITKKLVHDLISTAQTQALEVIDEHDIVQKLGLDIITKATISLTANNYVTEDPYGQEVKSLAISHVSAIAQNRLLAALSEGCEKVIPSADVERYSFMLVFYSVLKLLAPDTTEVCLVDVTHEATEIGIIRDDILRYVTHAPFGTYTIARDIAKLCNLPREEALTYVRGNNALLETLPEAKRAELMAILDTYEDKIAELFKRTGDELSIPRPLFIHTDSRTETFFSERISRAAASATKSEHGIHLVTKKLMENTDCNDSALLLSAYFFHKLHGSDDFEQV